LEGTGHKWAERFKEHIKKKGCREIEEGDFLKRLEKQSRERKSRVAFLRELDNVQMSDDLKDYKKR
jgi:hypothetical protein